MKKYLSFCILLALAAASFTLSPTTAFAGPPSGIEAGGEGSAPFDINTVSREELISIKGVGPKLAERILAYRDQAGSFTSIDELLEVQGIGVKNLSQFKEHLHVAPPPSPAAISSTKPIK